MISLLPSEIARLVLGYLEDRKFEQLAKLFLEASPDLQEYRLAISNGKVVRNTLCGMTLTDVIEKLCDNYQAGVRSRNMGEAEDATESARMRTEMLLTRKDANCNAATSTEDLFSYSCAQVQTTPYESEWETNNQPKGQRTEESESKNENENENTLSYTGCPVNRQAPEEGKQQEKKVGGEERIGKGRGKGKGKGKGKAGVKPQLAKLTWDADLQKGPLIAQEKNRRGTRRKICDSARKLVSAKRIKLSKQENENENEKENENANANKDNGNRREVPPTPRLLSPSSNATPFAKSSDKITTTTISTGTAATVTVTNAQSNRDVFNSSSSPSSPYHSSSFSSLSSHFSSSLLTVQTPTKAQPLLYEQRIAETPSSSKAGVVSLTDLSSKISILQISPFQSNESVPTEDGSSTKKLKEKPKIVSIEKARLSSLLKVIGKPSDASSKHFEMAVSESRQKLLGAKAKQIVVKRGNPNDPNVSARKMTPRRHLTKKANTCLSEKKKEKNEKEQTMRVTGNVLTIDSSTSSSRKEDGGAEAKRLPIKQRRAKKGGDKKKNEKKSVGKS